MPFWGEYEIVVDRWQNENQDDELSYSNWCMTNARLATIWRVDSTKKTENDH